MTTSDNAALLEQQIDQWRSYLRRRQAIHTVDVAELEDHLRAQVTLALLHVEGRGVPRDDKEARVWFEKAAEQGDAFSIEALQWRP